ncbi:MAG: hypothetical protein ACI4LI_05525 [Candidatus Fimenecus sp.]
MLEQGTKSPPYCRMARFLTQVRRKYAVLNHIVFDSPHLSFYLSPRIKGNVLHSVQTLSFTVKKAEFFAVLETAVQNGHISPADTNALVGSLREIYYRVPTVLARLVVQAFQQDRQQKIASIGGDI